MNNEIIMERVLDYCRSLEGTIDYKTKAYIGVKVNNKLYAEIASNRNRVSITLRKKYVTNTELEELDIKVVSINHGWVLDTRLNITEESNINNYLEILKRAYEGTKKEYEDKIEETINKAITSSERYIMDEVEREEYSFEKLMNKWEEFKEYKISNSNLDELKSEIEILNTFRSEQILESYKDQDEKYRFLIVMNEVISYIYKNDYNKQGYNEYEDKRTLALTFVRQKDWIKNLISYKKDKDLSKVTEVIKNVIIYINNPSSKITAFKNSKISQFIKMLNPNIKVEEDYDALCENVYKELDKFNIKVKNEENRGILYGKLMFTSEVVKLWDIENTYWKIQAYNSSNLEREKVDALLKDNTLITRDSNITNGATNNIFYLADKNNVMFLGVFIEDGTKEKDGFHYRKFMKIADPISANYNLPNDKVWGGKSSSKTFNVVKIEEKSMYESSILNEIFNIDIDELLLKIEIIKSNPEKTDVIDNHKNMIPDETEVIEIFKKMIDTPLNSILYGPPGTGKTYNTVNYAVSIVENRELDEVVSESINNRENVVSRYKKYLAEKRVVFTTFHQNYSYEDFIQGIRANTNNVDQLSFVKQDGVFKDLVERAKNNLGKNYAIVIDEINRGNISRIFGELITLIEEDKRLGEVNEISVTLPSKEIFSVPPNIFIVGTMNTADKSIALIDIALRRRFDFIPMYTNYELIPQFREILKPINKAIYDKKRSADYTIGHAFFVNKEIRDLDDIINKKIIPLLNEYFHGNINEVIEILNRGGIKVKQDQSTYQLYFNGLEA